jgi:hypothetical protein
MKIVKIISEQKRRFKAWKFIKIRDEAGTVIKEEWQKIDAPVRPGFKRVMAIVSINGLLQTKHLDVAK